VAEYISTFATGFEETAAQSVHSFLRGISVLRVYGGLIRYSYRGNAKDISRVPFFNNSFTVLRFFQGKNLSLGQMVSETASGRLRCPAREGTFRIRFSQSNQFVKVDKRISAQAESAVSKASRLRLDRLNPDTELWYVIRSEGFGFYGQLLRKRTATEKNLHKGELRPEFASLLCCCARPPQGSVILDPFAGYGSIPAQIARHFPYGRLLAGDRDPGKAQALRQALPDDARIQVFCGDALALAEISDESVDIIITDPPWGFYENVGDIAVFYGNMLREFGRILKSNGRAVLLCARDEAFAQAVAQSGVFTVEGMVRTLVNGRKADVYILNWDNAAANHQ